MARRPGRQAYPYQRRHAHALMPPAANVDSTPDAERAGLADRLKAAHAMVNQPVLKYTPLLPMERQHMRELVPHIAAAGEPPEGP